MKRSKHNAANSDPEAPLRILSKRALEQARRDVAEIERAQDAKRSGRKADVGRRARLKQLLVEIERYELLENGEVAAALGSSAFVLSELPGVLSAVRVAAKLSVAELARRLGVAASVIAKSESKDYQGVSVARAAEILTACGAFLQCRLELYQADPGAAGAAQALLDSALRCAESGKPALALEHVERGVRVCAAAECSAKRLELMRLKVRLLHQRGELFDAFRIARQVLALAEELADIKAIAQAHNACGALAKLQGSVKEASRYLQRAVESCRKVGDERTLAMALSNLATIHMESGEMELAESMFLEALTLQQRLGDAQGEVRTLSNLAIAVRTIAPRRSIPIYERCIELAAKVGDPHTQCTALCNLASISVELGLIDEAEKLFAHALELARQIRSDELEGLAQAGRARLAHLVGDFVQARDLFSRALNALGHSGERRIAAQAQANYAGLLAGLGRVEQAKEEYRRSLQIFRECDDRENLKFYGLELKALERGGETYLGVRPEGMPPELRKAVLKRLETERPDRYSDLERESPATVRLMSGA